MSRPRLRRSQQHGRKWQGRATRDEQEPGDRSEALDSAPSTRGLRCGASALCAADEPACTGIGSPSALVTVSVGSQVSARIESLQADLGSKVTRGEVIELRMAVRAKPWHVLAQFLVEAICLSLAGGAIGIILGSIVAKVVASRFELPFAPRADMGLLAFGFSLVVGVAFRLYPARKAARLDPIEALRYE
jgi:hypothetical protein